MKTISSIILGIFISNLILAQQRTNSTHQFLHLDTILFMPKEKQWMSGFKPLVCEWNNTLIFTNYNIFQKNDSIHVYFLNLFDNSIDNISLFYNGINKTFEKQNNFCFSCISFNGKYLVLGFYTYLLIYEKINNEFVFKKKIEFKHSFNDCWFVDDNRLFLTYMYNKIPPVVLCLYDIENNTLVKEIHPDFQHPLFAYFHPMHLIDVKNGHILFSQRLDYESTIYNQNLEVLYSIKRHSVPWMRMKQKNIDKIVNKYPRNEAGCIIAAVEKYLPKINQQLWTYFIDTNKILCVYQSPNVENKLYANTKVDIWEKKDSSWIITRESIIDFIEIITNEDSIIHNKSFGLAFTSGDKYIFTASNIIILKNKSSNIYPLGMKLSDYRSKSNAYFLKNDPILSVYIFSHTF